MKVVELKILASRFQIASGLERGYSIVEFSEGEVGLYLNRFSNAFGTPLALRGPRETIERILDEFINHKGYRPRLEIR